MAGTRDFAGLGLGFGLGFGIFFDFSAFGAEMEGLVLYPLLFLFSAFSQGGVWAGSG